MTIDTWVHIAELIIIGVLVPGVKKLITVLYILNISTDKLTVTLDNHTRAFADHVREDKERFKDLDEQIGETNGNIREMMGLMRLERRTGLERRSEV